MLLKAKKMPQMSYSKLDKSLPPAPPKKTLWNKTKTENSSYSFRFLSPHITEGSLSRKARGKEFLEPHLERGQWNETSPIKFYNWMALKGFLSINSGRLLVEKKMDSLIIRMNRRFVDISRMSHIQYFSRTHTYTQARAYT